MDQEVKKPRKKYEYNYHPKCVTEGCTARSSHFTQKCKDCRKVEGIKMKRKAKYR